MLQPTLPSPNPLLFSYVSIVLLFKIAYKQNDDSQQDQLRLYVYRSKVKHHRLKKEKNQQMILIILFSFYKNLVRNFGQFRHNLDEFYVKLHLLINARLIEFIVRKLREGYNRKGSLYKDGHSFTQDRSFSEFKKF